MIALVRASMVHFEVEMAQMENADKADPLVLLSPQEPLPCTLAILARRSKLPEIQGLQLERRQRIWRVRGVVSDSVPLSGDGDAAIAREADSQFFLNQNPISIYLHAGGRSAVYYDLIGDAQNRLQFIEVQVESALPDNALLLAHKPINALLDVFVRLKSMPLLAQRLELLSPADQSVLAYEMVLPCRQGISFGPMGGLMQRSIFAPYDALYREAITSSSPYYRLLCAWKVYDGIGRIRRFMREKAEEFGIQERLPPDPPVDRDELTRLGFTPDFLDRVRTANDIFGQLTEMRNGIAHFLFRSGAGEGHVYLADGIQLRIYSTAASALLLYAERMLSVLRDYYNRNLEARLMKGMILPMPQNRAMFIVRARDAGVE
jgi:hypothetical protein